MIILVGDGECRILLSVFSYLTTAELCRVARVSRKWYTISKHPDLWSRVAISETVITSQVSAQLIQQDKLDKTTNLGAAQLVNSTKLLTLYYKFTFFIREKPTRY